MVTRVVGIRWTSEDECEVVAPGDGDCYGVVVEGELFAPADGQSNNDYVVDWDGEGHLDPHAGWYRVRDGRLAIVGIPGVDLAVIE